MKTDFITSALTHRASLTPGHGRFWRLLTIFKIFENQNHPVKHGVFCVFSYGRPRLEVRCSIQLSYGRESRFSAKNTVFF